MGLLPPIGRKGTVRPSFDYMRRVGLTLPVAGQIDPKILVFRLYWPICNCYGAARPEHPEPLPASDRSESRQLAAYS